MIGLEAQTEALLIPDEGVPLKDGDVVAPDGDGQRITWDVLRNCSQTQILIG